MCVGFVKIKFIFPSFERHSQSNPELLNYLTTEKKYIGIPSGGIAILAALTAPEIEVSFIDDRIEKIDYEEEVDLVALSFFTAQATRAFQIADEYRKRNKTVVAGGIFPSVMPEETLQHVDSVVIGEGENVWGKIIEDFRNKKLKRIYTSKSFFNLNKSPSPKWELYFEKENKGYTGRDYPLQVIRGCPMNCFNCVIPIYMKNNFRYRAINKVINEMVELKKKGKSIILTDDALLLPFLEMRSYLYDLISEIIQKEISIYYLGASMSQILWIDTSIFSLLKKVNMQFFYLSFGYDSLSIKIFSKEATKIDKAKAINVINKIHDAGIGVHADIVIGADTDDVGIFDRILKFCDMAKFDRAQFSIITPYPKTPLWKQMVAQNRIIDREWKHYNDANVVFKPAKMTEEELRQGYLYLWREFYKNRDLTTISKIFPLQH